jgi:beta-glucuronidase
VRPWSPEDPFLYRLSVRLGGGESVIDDYPMKIGVRTIEVHGSELRLNGKPLFLTGFGKHEDFPMHGKGLDLPVLVRDFELLKWIGANSFRTSHYPYSEEAMMLADEYGFLVIAETPGVSLVFMDPPEIIEARYRQLEGALTELVHRDKNHPCVIFWSLANEPIPKPFHTNDDAPSGAVETGTAFFKRLFATPARLIRPGRWRWSASRAARPTGWAKGDIICTNSYNGWYAISGELDRAGVVLEAGDHRASGPAWRQADHLHRVWGRRGGGDPRHPPRCGARTTRPICWRSIGARFAGTPTSSARTPGPSPTSRPRRASCEWDP